VAIRGTLPIMVTRAITRRNMEINFMIVVVFLLILGTPIALKTNNAMNNHGVAITGKLSVKTAAKHHEDIILSNE
jgi:hypothetical protein